jgi:ferredoxin
MLKILISQKECLGCDYCESCCPEIFKVDNSDYKSKLKNNGCLTVEAMLDLSPGQISKIKEAESNCPAKAIKIEE